MQQDEKSQGAEKLNDQNTGANQESAAENNNVAAAHIAAEQDIESDPDLATTDDPAADLDEGELARLDNSNDGEEK